ncbi:hypothetical protein B5S32_g1830 [[Candida] boidinii]|nr:hypothetical protein B5S29_g500 [[Candida] boidinii]OWB77656.1 hypothetical protein B5S32_g1830 [[Candida] boidinii]
MKYSYVLSAAALASSAIAEDIEFVVKSDNELNGRGVYNIHEGAGINYWFVSSDASTTGPLTYDAEAGTITEPFTEQYLIYFDVLGSFIAQSVAGPNADLTFDDEGVLSINGTSTIQACNDVQDPYSYSKNSRALIFGDAPNDACLPIELVKKAYSDASESASESASVTSTTETQSTFSTVTSTLTSCSDNACTDISTYNGGANNAAVPVFGAAVAAGLALLM